VFLLLFGVIVVRNLVSDLIFGIVFLGLVYLCL
jgi:hypothetical protein